MTTKPKKARRAWKIGQACCAGVILVLLQGLMYSVFPQVAFVRNMRTGRTFPTLGAAVADATTKDRDVLFVNGIITEMGPVIVNKALTIAGAPFHGGEIRGAAPTMMHPAVLDVTDRPGQVLIQNLRIRVPTSMSFAVHGILSNAPAGNMAGSDQSLAVFNCVIEEDTTGGVGVGITGVAVFNQDEGTLPIPFRTAITVQGNTIRGRNFSPAGIVVDGFNAEIVVNIKTNRVELLTGGSAPAGTNWTANGMNGGILVSDIPTFLISEGFNNVTVAGNRLISTAAPTNGGFGIAILDVKSANVGGNLATGFMAANSGFGIVIGSVSDASAGTSFYDDINTGSDGARVMRNVVTGNRVGIGVDIILGTAGMGEDLAVNASAGTIVQLNTIRTNTAAGLDFGLAEPGATGRSMATLPGFNLDATRNFWGVASGPTGTGCPGMGQEVRAAATDCGTMSNQVSVTPVLILPPVIL